MNVPAMRELNRGRAEFARAIEFEAKSDSERVVEIRVLFEMLIDATFGSRVGEALENALKAFDKTIEQGGQNARP